MKKLVVGLFGLVLAFGSVECSAPRRLEFATPEKVKPTQGQGGSDSSRDAAPSPFKQVSDKAYQFAASTLAPLSPLKETAEIIFSVKKSNARKEAVEKWFAVDRSPEALRAFVEEQKEAKNFFRIGDLINAVDSKNETLLDKVAHEGLTEAAACLLDLDAHPNRAYSDGDTLLHRLVRKDVIDSDMVDRLLEYDADPNGQGADGDTALQILAKKDILHANIDLFNLLFHHGAQPRVLDSDENTLLHLLASNGLTQEHPLYALLVGKGIDPKKENTYCLTVEDIIEDFAEAQREQENAKDALPEDPVTPPSARKVDPEEELTVQNLFGSAKKMVQDLGSFFSNKLSTEARAARKQALEAWWALDLTSDSASTVLKDFVEAQKTSGAYYDELQVVLNLVNAVDEQGDTRLNRLIKQQGLTVHRSVISCFKEIHADFGMADKTGNTILHTLARKGLSKKDLAFVQELIDYGARPSKRNNKNETVLHLLAAQEAGEKLDQEMVEWWVKQGVQPTEQDSSGNTLLHLLAEPGMPQDMKFFKYLIETQNVDPGVADNKGDTFLHIIARKGLKKTDLEKIEQLPGWWIVASAFNKNNETILHLRACQDQFDKEIVTWWKQHSVARLDRQDSKGNTFLHLLALKGSQDIDIFKEVVTAPSVELGTLTNHDGDTVLHILARKGLKKEHPLYVYLVGDGKIDPTKHNDAGESVLELMRAFVENPGAPGNGGPNPVAPAHQPPAVRAQDPRPDQTQRVNDGKRKPLITAWNVLLTGVLSGTLYLLYKKYTQPKPSAKAVIQQS